MRNTEGKYVVTRLMNSSGALLKGVGSTKEEAREQLRAEVQKYRESIRLGLYFQPTGEKVKSPGLVTHQTPSGTIILRQDDRREVAIMARPEIAKYIRGGRKDNILKETRQIRRQAQ